MNIDTRLTAATVHLDKQFDELVRTALAVRDDRDRYKSMLDEIWKALDGETWDNDTLSEIALILTDNGYILREPGE